MDGSVGATGVILRYSGDYVHRAGKDVKELRSRAAQVNEQATRLRERLGATVPSALSADARSSLRSHRRLMLSGSGSPEADAPHPHQQQLW